jgi:predicted DNA-binding WGR domain protein
MVRDRLRDEARVSALILYRIDPARRMRRFYIMDVQPDLFGQWSFIREWGRIGSPGQMRIATCPNEDEARARLARHRQIKERRGYCPAPGSGTATLPR